MAGLEAMNINLSLKDRDQLFKHLDVSHDGALSYREFCSIWGKQLPNSHSLDQIEMDVDQIS
jgi:hypothetical protein